jgi:hypothetical protein
MVSSLQRMVLPLSLSCRQVQEGKQAKLAEPRRARDSEGGEMIEFIVVTFLVHIWILHHRIDKMSDYLESK